MAFSPLELASTVLIEARRFNHAYRAKEYVEASSTLGRLAYHQNLVKWLEVPPIGPSGLTPIEEQATFQVLFFNKHRKQEKKMFLLDIQKREERKRREEEARERRSAANPPLQEPTPQERTLEERVGSLETEIRELKEAIKSLREALRKGNRRTVY